MILSNAFSTVAEETNVQEALCLFLSWCYANQMLGTEAVLGD